MMLRGDGEPVLSNDDPLTLTTGSAGEMARTPFATVRGLDASLGFSRRYGRLGGRAFAGRPDCRVPSLEDTAACLLDLGLTPNVEIKPTPGLAAKTAEVALTRLLALWPRDRLPPLVSSFRSEEHTSELQSLMRISYAVFCLKKKTKKYQIK